MHESNPETINSHHHPKKDYSPVEPKNQNLMTQIQQLKKVILNLEHRQKNKVRKGDNKSIQNENQLQELKQKTAKGGTSQSRLQFGNSYYKDINQNFRARMVQKKHRVSQEREDQRDMVNTFWQEGEEEKSIIHMTEELGKVDSSNFVSQRPQSQQEQCPRTQLFTPASRPRNNQSTSQVQQFHFKKLDYIPAIDQDNNKFNRYMNSYKQRKASSLKKRFMNEQQQTATSTFQMINTTSQPQLSKKKKGGQMKEGERRVQTFPEFNITKQSQKEELIEIGQKMFNYFIPAFQATDKFTIKKYKNCIVFSLLPILTKALIWYYTKQLYFGNISLNEQNKIQKNGPGVQMVKGRHKYQGYFINSKKNGRGKIVYQNGDQYDGQWCEGEIYGFGRFKEIKNNKVFQGFWKHGEFCCSVPNSDPFASNMP